MHVNTHRDTSRLHPVTIAIWLVTTTCLTLQATAKDFGDLAIIGDSITQADDATLGYRYNLWKKLIDDGADFNLVGSQTVNFGGTPVYPDYRGNVYPNIHEGHWGWRADEILNNTGSRGSSGAGNLNQWLNDAAGGYTPDTALILIGSNDVAAARPTNLIVSDIGTIIDTLQADNPSVDIYLGSIIPRQGPIFTTEIPAVNNQLPGLAALKTTAASTVTFVDHFPTIDIASHLYDGIHPNAIGEEILAQNWAVAMDLQPPSGPRQVAGPLTVRNPSFETPGGLDILNDIDAGGAVDHGWEFTNTTSAGSFAPRAESTLFYSGFDDPPGLDGTRSGFIFNARNGPPSVEQQLAGPDAILGNGDDPQLTENIRYEVTASFGRRDGTLDPGTGGFNFELLAGDAVIAGFFAAAASDVAPAGQYADVTITVDVAVGDEGFESLLGEALTVRITGLTQPSNNGYLDFDHLRVVASEILTPGDANGDGRVDAGDLNTLALNWQQAVTGWANADFNRDGVVSAADLNLLALNWQSGADAFTVMVPEPGTVALFASGMMRLASRRQGRR